MKTTAGHIGGWAGRGGRRLDGTAGDWGWVNELTSFDEGINVDDRRVAAWKGGRSWRAMFLTERRGLNAEPGDCPRPEFGEVGSDISS